MMLQEIYMADIWVYVIIFGVAAVIGFIVGYGPWR
jgi:hypothetical protein